MCRNASTGCLNAYSTPTTSSAALRNAPNPVGVGSVFGLLGIGLVLGIRLVWRRGSIS